MPRNIRKRRFRPSGAKVWPSVLPALVAIGVSFLFFRAVSARLRPVVETAAAGQVTNLLSAHIGSAVDGCLMGSGMGYSDFIDLEVNSAGAVTSLSSRPAEAGRFRRQVVDAIVERLNRITAEDLSVPIGNLSGSIILSGLGPEIRVEVYAVGEVTATYRNSFTEAGVNQTHHGLYLDITATVHLLIPGEIIPVTVTERFCVAETVILGAVPDTYIHMEKGAD